METMAACAHRLGSCLYAAVTVGFQIYLAFTERATEFAYGVHSRGSNKVKP